MKGNVLITGGTGLIGSRLTEILLQNGYHVSYLSRTKENGNIKKYQWSVEKKTLDEEAIKNADFIINLAGANVFDHKWSKEYKREILESRSESTNLLFEKLKSTPHQVKAFVSASAIGYYGADTGDKIIFEDAPAGDDFLASVVQQWETAVDRIEQLKIRTVKFRIGIVLSDKGGALEKLLNPIRKGAGAVLGSGKQFVSWIHIDDMCNILLKAIEDEKLTGVYNAAAPHPVNNEELTKTAAAKVHKTIHLPHVPHFALKWMLGSERSDVVIGGNNVSAEKILKTGFQFKFPQLNEALDDLIK